MHRTELAVPENRNVVVALSRYARALARHYGAGEVSEDVAQDALIDLLRAPALVRHPKAWLRTVVRRKVAQHFAEQGQHTSLGELIPAATHSGGHTTDSGLALREAIDRLSGRDRQILILKLLGFSYAEIAEIAGLPVNSVGTFVSRAYAQARQILTS